MANTTFVNQSTVIDASWLNDVNDVSYDVLGDGTNVPSSKAVVRANLNVPQRDGTDASGTWGINISGTAAGLTSTLAVANGGTGATSAANARTNLGLVIGTDVLAPNGDAGSLTNIPAANLTGDIAQARIATAVNATGSAPIFSCRAWVNFNGTGTVAIRASGNVSSITDNGVGDYTVNFTTALPDANYAIHATGDNSVLLAVPADSVTPRTAGAARVRTVNSSFVLTDCVNVNFSVFR